MTRIYFDLGPAWPPGGVMLKTDNTRVQWTLLDEVDSPDLCQVHEKTVSLLDGSYQDRSQPSGFYCWRLPGINTVKHNGTGNVGVSSTGRPCQGQSNLLEGTLEQVL